MTEDLSVAFVFVVILQALMFLVASATADLNPSSQFYNPEGSLISRADAGGYVLDTEAILSGFPEGEGSISPTTGNFFTDSFASIKRWFTSLPGINYVYALVMAPYNLLNLMHLPVAFVFGIGTMWYLFAIFITIIFFWGR